MKTSRDRLRFDGEKVFDNYASIAEALQSAYPELADITDVSWREAVRNATTHQFKARAILLGGSAPTKQFLLLLEGSARVYYSDHAGRQITLYCVNPGDFCILSLGRMLHAYDLDVMVQARTDIRAIGIPERDFRVILGASEKFRNYVLTSLSQRLTELVRLVQDAVFQNIEIRLACLLERLFEQARSASLKITHQELAQDLGASREVVSRALKDFEGNGCIKLRRGRIEMIDPAALAKLGRNSSR